MIALQQVRSTLASVPREGYGYQLPSLRHDVSVMRVFLALEQYSLAFAQTHVHNWRRELTGENGECGRRFLVLGVVVFGVR